MARYLHALTLLIALGSTGGLNAQLLAGGPATFTRADTLRGSLNANRTWWDVKRYDLEVEPDYATRSIRGRSTIKFSGSRGGAMQIDLQQPMVVDSVLFRGQRLPFTRDGDIALIRFPENMRPLKGEEFFISIYYHGTPRAAKRPPWDGGWIWARDQQGRPWMSVACQGLGASVWYPCKDHQSDKPDEGASLTVIVPDTLVAVANGRLVSQIDRGNTVMYRWEVRNPINTYNLVPYIGHYTSFSEVYDGEDGKLNCTYWVLDYNLEKARVQFQQVPPMLKCFEHWFGPYPFYEDGYQLVEAPHLGMEHQSAIAYGNRFANGYLGRDLSGTGWGNLWDFIIIHESGHEWFGNNITSKDIADMWIHESFTNYSETLFTECQSGREAGQAYVQGIRRNILNDRPIIGPYGVNQEGSGDMYYKGANMIHTIRTMMDNDEKFRQMLRGMNRTFYHQTVTTQQIEEYIEKHSGLTQDLKGLFDQYLRTTKIPVVEWKISKGVLSARLRNTVPHLTLRVWMPTDTDKGEWHWLSADKWTSVGCRLTEVEADTKWNKNLYVEYKAVAP